MAGARFGGHASMGDPKGAVVQDSISYEGGEVPRFRGLVGIRVLLEAFVCAQAVA